MPNGNQFFVKVANINQSGNIVFTFHNPKAYAYMMPVN
jgi:hypothetical protein